MESPPLVALITAGSAGLGVATAKVFSSSGMRVVINFSSNESRAEQVAQELERLSTIPKNAGTKDFSSIRADLSRRDEIVRLVSEAIAAMGRLDVIFSNGGWTLLRNFEDLDDNMNEEDWHKGFTMNVKVTCGSSMLLGNGQMRVEGFSSLQPVRLVSNQAEALWCVLC